MDTTGSVSYNIFKKLPSVDVQSNFTNNYCTHLTCRTESAIINRGLGHRANFIVVIEVVFARLGIIGDHVQTFRPFYIGYFCGQFRDGWNRAFCRKFVFGLRFGIVFHRVRGNGGGAGGYIQRATNYLPVYHVHRLRIVELHLRKRLD